VALRCRIVLSAAAGESDVAIAKQLSVNRNTVILWPCTTWVEAWRKKVAAGDGFPRPRILHPYPEQRFAARHPR